MKQQRLKYCCPDCGARIIRRTSEVVHPLLQKFYIVCTNLACGATYLGNSEITHRLSPPTNPNPEISLPWADSVKRSAASKAGV